MSRTSRLVRIAILPLAHLCLCFIAVYVLPLDDYNTNWMPIILLDFPVFAILVLFKNSEFENWFFI
jgi:hypothetical protein